MKDCILQITLFFTCLLLSACSQATGATGALGTASQLGNPSISNNATGTTTGIGAPPPASSLPSIIAPNIIGQMDQASKEAALLAEQQTLESGATSQSVQWQGSNDISGEVIPEQTYQVGSQNCRRFTHTVIINSVPQKNSGTSCRQPDGTWTPLT